MESSLLSNSFKDTTVAWSPISIASPDEINFILGTPSHFFTVT